MATGYVQLDCDQNSVGFIHLKTDSTNIQRNSNMTSCNKIKFPGYQRKGGFVKKPKLLRIT